MFFFLTWEGARRTPLLDIIDLRENNNGHLSSGRGFFEILLEIDMWLNNTSFNNLIISKCPTNLINITKSSRTSTSNLAVREQSPDQINIPQEKHKDKMVTDMISWCLF